MIGNSPSVQSRIDIPTMKCCSAIEGNKLLIDPTLQMNLKTFMLSVRSLTQEHMKIPFM